jgi:hypothetical protein
LSVAQGVFHGARTGGQIGALGGPWGAAAGVVVGGIVGGVAIWWAGDKLADGISTAMSKGEDELSGEDEGTCEGECEQSDANPPRRGEPGSTVQGPDQTRTYGPDGYPQTDRDRGHPNEKGVGNGDHVHDWGRPLDGGPPTHTDRGLSRPPRPGDPPKPWRDATPTS